MIILERFLQSCFMNAIYIMSSKRFVHTLILLLVVSGAWAQQPALKLNLRQGEEYRLVISSNQAVQQTMMGNLQKTRSYIVSGCLFHVKRQTPESVTLAMHYDSIFLKMEMPDGIIEGSTTDTTRKNALLSGALREILKSALNIQISATGEITSITGLDTTFLSGMDKYTAIPAQVRTMLKSALTEKFGTETLGYRLQEIFGLFPAKSVKTGGRWRTESFLDYEAPARVQNTWTLVSQNQNVNSLSLEGKISPPAQNGFFPINGIPMKYILKGTRKGNFDLDGSSGWIKNGQISQSVSGTVYLREGISWPIAIETTFIYRGEKLLGGEK